MYISILFHKYFESMFKCQLLILKFEDNVICHHVLWRQNSIVEIVIISKVLSKGNLNFPKKDQLICICEKGMCNREYRNRYKREFTSS